MKRHSDPAMVGSFLVLIFAFAVITIAAIAGAIESTGRCVKHGGSIQRDSNGLPYCTAKVPK